MILALFQFLTADGSQFSNYFDQNSSGRMLEMESKVVMNASRSLRRSTPTSPASSPPTFPDPRILRAIERNRSLRGSQLLADNNCDPRREQVGYTGSHGRTMLSLTQRQEFDKSLRKLLTDRDSTKNWSSVAHFTTPPSCGFLSHD